ncbi:hypothetical protein QTP88_000253 [Uroleucon formosanum]
MSNNNSNINTFQPGNSPSKDYLTRDLSAQLRIFQLNVEGISSDKSRYLERLLKEHKIDVVLLQETHVSNELQMTRRATISGYTLISALYHRSYGSATYVRNDKPRWNFRKADWHTFAKSIDANIRWIKPTSNNYDRFVGFVKGTAKRCIP